LLLRQALGEFKIQYTSPLSRAQKAEEAAGFVRTMQIAVGHAQATGSPEALDWLDVDAAMPTIADINAMPASWVRDIHAVMAIRQGRSQQQQIQQSIEASPALAGLVKGIAPNK